MAKILVVEDDADLADRVRAWLEAERHMAEVAPDGNVAMEHLGAFTYDVIILDWELPGLTGPEVCRKFRAQGGATPIIMLTGKDKVSDKEVGLDAGADDYLTKPFHVKELSARIRALMRRPSAVMGATLKIADLELDPTAHKLTKDGKDVDLLPKEFALLEFFMRHPNQLFSPEALLDRVWHSDSESTIETVYTYIKRLRAKIDTDKKNSLIKTVYGLGYRLEWNG
jgi:OmpR-family two-component system manganese-sensing response regulator